MSVFRGFYLVTVKCLFAGRNALTEYVVSQLSRMSCVSCVNHDSCTWPWIVIWLTFLVTFCHASGLSDILQNSVVPYNRSCWRQESYYNIHGGKILKGIQQSPQPCPVRRQSPYAHISFRSCWWSIYYWHQLYTLVQTLFHYRRMSYLYSISDLRMTMRQMMHILTWIHY